MNGGGGDTNREGTYSSTSAGTRPGVAEWSALHPVFNRQMAKFSTAAKLTHAKYGSIDEILYFGSALVRVLVTRELPPKRLALCGFPMLFHQAVQGLLNHLPLRQPLPPFPRNPRLAPIRPC